MQPSSVASEDETHSRPSLGLAFRLSRSREPPSACRPHDGRSKTGCQRGVVLNQGNVGGQTAAARTLEQERQQERRHGLSNNTPPYRLGNRLVDEAFHLL